MGFSKKNYSRVRAQFEEKKAAAETAAEMKTAALRIKYPEIGEIDRELSRLGVELVNAALDGTDALQEKLDGIKDRSVTLRNRRREILVSEGLKENEDEPEYECAVCRDEGYVDGRMCECLRTALINETFESSGIGDLAKRQSFDNFSTKYYEFDPKALESIRIILLLCRDFAENFEPRNGKNLLFIGDTGLGKTHLSTAVATEVIRRGYDVVYDTAQNVFSDFENERFNRGDESNADLTEKYFDCDLLIIDDLGTELTNSFTLSCLYNIINDRTNHRKSMIINTNLTQSELRSRYADRITSRLFGEFSPMHFLGRDVRRSKLLSTED